MFDPAFYLELCGKPNPNWDVTGSKGIAKRVIKFIEEPRSVRLFFLEVS